MPFSSHRGRVPLCWPSPYTRLTSTFLSLSHELRPGSKICFFIMPFRSEHPARCSVSSEILCFLRQQPVCKPLSIHLISAFLSSPVTCQNKKTVNWYACSSPLFPSRFTGTLFKSLFHSPTIQTIFPMRRHTLGPSTRNPRSRCFSLLFTKSRPNNCCFPPMSSEQPDTPHPCRYCPESLEFRNFGVPSCLILLSRLGRAS